MGRDWERFSSGLRNPLPNGKVECEYVGADRSKKVKGERVKGEGEEKTRESVSIDRIAKKTEHLTSLGPKGPFWGGYFLF